MGPVLCREWHFSFVSRRYAGVPRTCPGTPHGTTYPGVPILLTTANLEAWLGIGRLMRSVRRAPPTRCGLYGLLRHRTGWKSGKTTKNRVFRAPFSPAAGREPPGAPTDLRIESDPGEGCTFRVLRGRRTTFALQAQTGPHPVYPVFAARRVTRERVRPLWSAPTAKAQPAARNRQAFRDRKRLRFGWRDDRFVCGAFLLGFRGQKGVKKCANA